MSCFEISPTNQPTFKYHLMNKKSLVNLLEHVLLKQTDFQMIETCFCLPNPTPQLYNLFDPSHCPKGKRPLLTKSRSNRARRSSVSSLRREKFASLDRLHLQYCHNAMCIEFHLVGCMVLDCSSLSKKQSINNITSNMETTSGQPFKAMHNNFATRLLYLIAHSGNTTQLGMPL